MADEIYYIVEKVFYVLTVALIVWNLPVFLTIFVFVPLLLKLWSRISLGWCKSLRRLDGRTVVITGSNTGIGLETAKDLAGRGARVILACRNQKKGNEALELIRAETGNAQVFLKSLDLADFGSVRKFANEIKAEEKRLDILINNAGVHFMENKKTKDGLETNFQSNYFGPFLLTHLLLDLMSKTEGESRIVMVSSQLHNFARTLDVNDLNSETEFKPFMIYARTKLATNLFTREMAKRLKEKDVKNVTINAVHPGGVRTDVMKDAYEHWYIMVIHTIMKFFYKSVPEGAQTQIHVAVSEKVDGVSGEYFSDCKPKWTSSLSKDNNLARQLWDKSVKSVGLKKGENIVL